MTSDLLYDIEDTNEIKPSFTALWLAIQPNYLIVQEDGFNEGNLRKAIEAHKLMIPRYMVLDSYRHGIMSVYKRKRLSELEKNINCIAVYPEPRFISLSVNGFAYGRGATYELDEDDALPNDQQALDEILKLYKRQDIDKIDSTIEDYLSTFGRALELNYIDDDDGETVTVSVARRPEDGFCVYNNLDDKKVLYSVLYTAVRDEKNQIKYYDIAVYDELYLYRYRTATNDLSSFIFVSQEEHYMGANPITEYFNNEELKGDFEPIISLIDAKNEMGSDNLNALRQFIENILVFYGITLGNDEAEEKKQYNKIKKNRWFSTKFAQGSRLENVNQQIDYAGMDTAKKSISQDIAKYSMIPDFTSEKFQSIQSGVAMAFGLMGIKALVGVKKPFLIKGLRQRLRKYANILSIRLGYTPNIKDVTISFTDMTPAIDIEVATIIPSALSVGVKKDVLAKQFSFVNDDQQLEEVDETGEQTLEELFKGVETPQVDTTDLSEEKEYNNPMPKPAPNESEEDFIARFISNAEMQNEYQDEEQRLAVAYETWRNK